MLGDTTNGSPAALRACSNHPQREAVARCPECGHLYCRECITEHDYRMICASCLAKVRDGGDGDAKNRRVRLPLAVMPLVHAGVAVVFLWFLFFTLAQTLLEIPADVHEGTLFGDTVEALFVEQ